MFEIGPVFRAENSHTAYHATEFTSIDAEISWINSHHDVMDMEEAVCKHILKTLKSQINDEYQAIFKK
ncbi:MAG TPA: hypothetical protein P5198_10290, partial [Flexilinea sp.]|nr:hypothetical protein [Flexilinea sp.]